MRAGGFTVQQALTAEAATVIKQAVTLARRRGHAQVTPLHVASTMLSSSTGLLRTACLQSQSHSHPLQCKALELCFNVALNRLPASSSSPMLSLPHSHHPSISNALVAAFKRAQAHQRRGSIENQQQPLLAVKIELEQLIISILDDPSVSRVMREAGFSSTLVKTNVEQTVSLELCSQTPESSNKSSNENNNNLVVLSHHESATGAKVGKRGSQNQVRDEDVTSVIESLMNKTRKSLVIVGENVVNIESIVSVVKDKVDQGDVPEALRDVKIISIPLFSFENLSRGKVEKKLEELMRSMRSFVDKGLILYLGDLNWITEYRSSNEGQNCYCPVEHMISELGRLAYGIGESGKFWFMGIASFQTYMKCKTAGYPSLESAWRLHPLTVPAGALAFSLIPADSNVQKDCESKKSENGCRWLLSEGGEEKQLSCCADCTTQFEIEAARNSRNTTCHGESTSSTLPSWLRDESKRLNSHDQDSAAASSSVKELCKKWNMYCSSFHKQLNYSYNEKTLTYSSATSPNSSSTSCFSYDRQNPNFQHFTRKMWPVFEPKQSPFTDHEYWNSASNNAKNCDPILTMCIPEYIRFSNPNSTPNSASSSDVMEMEYVTRFKEFNAKNLNTICNALEKKVPWQKDIIHEIAGTILQCRSGMMRRKEKRCVDDAKEETWFFFQGVDAHAKEKVARELARVVFGSSHSNFVTITLSSFSSTRADSTEDLRNYKRSRDEQSCSYIEKFAEAVSLNPHRVFFIEDVEQADYCSQMGMKRAIESGRIRNSSGEEVSLGDSIIILSCESFSSRSRVCSPPIKKNTNYDSEVQTAMSPCMSLDLNMSFGDDDVDDESTATDHMSIDDIGLLESVDRLIIFKIQEL